MVINGQAIPPGTQLSIGLFPGHTRMLLIKDGAPLSCSSTSNQPAAHITPSEPRSEGNDINDTEVIPAATQYRSADPMTVEQRSAFDRDGYLIIRGALASG